MFLRSSAPIAPAITLVTLGATCRYAVTTEAGSIALSDPGASVHVHSLSERFELLHLALKDVNRVFITHLDADRIAGIPLLRRLLPGVQVYGSRAMSASLKEEALLHSIWEQDRAITAWYGSPSAEIEVPSFEEFKAGLYIDVQLEDPGLITLEGDISIRVISSPGHRRHSLSYLVLPQGFIITDETFGYNQGRRLCAPGGDLDLNASLRAVKSFVNHEITGIGFPYVGAITGDLVKKHFESLEITTRDLFSEVRLALESGLSEHDIKAQVEEALYTATVRDPCLIHSLAQSLESIWKQVFQAAGNRTV